MRTVKKNTKAILISTAFLINILFVTVSCSNANRDENTNNAAENTGNGAMENSSTMDSADVHQNTINGEAHHTYINDSVQK